MGLLKSRSVLYIKDFFRNLKMYWKKPIEIQKLQIWVGQVCTLNCKNCSQLFPYIPKKIYNIDDVIKSAKLLLKYLDPYEIHIIGGEPFTNKNISKLINFIGSINPNKPNKIVSNGTIIPNEETIRILSKNKDNIFITVSMYDCVREKQLNFIEYLANENIKVCPLDDCLEWYYMGDTNQQKISNKVSLQKNFDACHDRTCTTLANWKLSVCPRMHNSNYIFKHKNRWIENLPIKILDMLPPPISRALVATCLTQNTYREACHYCYGVSEVNNLYCKKAEQLERKL